MNKIIQVEYTPEEKNRKEPDIVKLAQYEKDCKFYISKRNELVREVYE
ncbi:MAG: hypothetical protein ACI4ON_00315 [Clostridia bacterium]